MAEQPAPHLARPERRAALRIVLVTVRCSCSLPHKQARDAILSTTHTAQPNPQILTPYLNPPTLDLHILPPNPNNLNSHQKKTFSKPVPRAPSPKPQTSNPTPQTPNLKPSNSQSILVLKASPKPRHQKHSGCSALYHASPACSSALSLRS